MAKVVSGPAAGIARCDHGGMPSFECVINSNAAPSYKNGKGKLGANVAILDKTNENDDKLNRMSTQKKKIS